LVAAASALHGVNDALNAPYKSLAVAVSSLIQLGRDDPLSTSGAAALDSGPLRDATSAIVLAIRQLLEVSAVFIRSFQSNSHLCCSLFLGGSEIAACFACRRFRTFDASQIAFASRRASRIVSFRRKCWSFRHSFRRSITCSKCSLSNY
jgi:hypothetical protein